MEEPRTFGNPRRVPDFFFIYNTLLKKKMNYYKCKYTKLFIIDGSHGICSFNVCKLVFNSI